MNQDTRAVTTSKEDIDRLIAAMERRGGQITIADPRVSSLQNWVMAAVGTGLVGVLGWGVMSINKLNTTMERVVTQNEYMAKQLDAQDRRIYSLEQRR